MGKQLDAFEVAKEIVRAEYKKKHEMLESEKRSYENPDAECYDSGLSEIEARNEVRAIEKDIEYLDQEYESKINSLNIPTKDDR